LSGATRPAFGIAGPAARPRGRRAAVAGRRFGRGWSRPGDPVAGPPRGSPPWARAPA